MGLNRSRIRRKAVTAGLKRLSDAFQSDMAFDHWQRTQAIAREALLQELYKLWDSDLGDLELEQLSQIPFLEKTLGVCSWHPPWYVQLCNHCGEVLNDDGTCPGLCTPTERDQ